MKRPTLSLIEAAPLSAPAPAQPAGATWDGDDLISMMFMSEDELIGADVTSILVHDIMPEDSIIHATATSPTTSPGMTRISARWCCGSIRPGTKINSDSRTPNRHEYGPQRVLRAVLHIRPEKAGT